MFIWGFSYLLRKAFICYAVPSTNCFCSILYILYGCVFIVICFNIFLNFLFDFTSYSWFFSSMLFSSMSPYNHFFSFLFLGLISSFITLWWEKMLEITSILLNLLQLVCALMCGHPRECSMCIWIYVLFSFGCNVLQISIKSNCSIVSFSISVALLIFCLQDLSIHMSWVKVSYYYWIPVSFSVMFVSICFMQLSVPIIYLNPLVRSLQLNEKIKQVFIFSSVFVGHEDQINRMDPMTILTKGCMILTSSLSNEI